jgi:ABC-type nitrate/sulfonate/bicarbonate transport system permease component
MYGSNFNFPTAILIAVAIIALMVLAFDLLLLTAQRLLTPWRKVKPR